MDIENEMDDAICKVLMEVVQDLETSDILPSAWAVGCEDCKWAGAGLMPAPEVVPCPHCGKVLIVSMYK